MAVVVGLELVAVIASFLAAWAAYIVGKALHVSGVLTTVACGLVMGWRQHAVLSAVTRTQAQAVWKVIVFILESLIFILIGLSLRGVVERLGGDWHSILKLLPPVAVLIVAVIVTRFIWILPAVAGFALRRFADFTYVGHLFSPDN